MSEDRTAWDARARASIDGLAPLRFLVGRFEGQGQDHGAPIRAEAEGLLRLDGSWLELRERLREPDGTLLYEDFALYRFDPVDGQLRVMHFSARAWLSRYRGRSALDHRRGRPQGGAGARRRGLALPGHPPRRDRASGGAAVPRRGIR